MSGTSKRGPSAHPPVWWDAHTDKVPRSSDQWAASDRGWLVSADEETPSLGHYLDYGHDHLRTTSDWCVGCGGEHARQGSGRHCAACQPGTVHAVSCVTRAFRYCVTVDEAQRWIEQQAGIAEPCPVNPRRRK